METPLWIIAVCEIVFALVLVAVAVGAVWGMFAAKKFVTAKIDQAMEEVKPIAEQARAIADQAKRTADVVAEKVDSIMTTAEDTAGSVGNTMKSVSEKMEGAIDPRVVNLAGIVGTAAKAVQICRDIKTIRSDSKPAEEPSSPDG